MDVAAVGGRRAAGGGPAMLGAYVPFGVVVMTCIFGVRNSFSCFSGIDAARNGVVARWLRSLVTCKSTGQASLIS